MGKKIEEYGLFELMQKIEEVLNQNPAPIDRVNIIYQFDISGDEEGCYQLQLHEGKATVVEGEDKESECTLQMSFKSFRQFLVGSMNGAMAFMTGKLKVKGSMGKALKLESILEQYQLEAYL